MSLRRCSCTSNLQLFSIHAGFTTPLFLCLRLAQVPSVWNTTRNVWNIRETPDGFHARSISGLEPCVEQVCCCCLGKSCYVLALPAGAVFPAEPARRSALPHMSRHVLVCLCSNWHQDRLYRRIYSSIYP